MSNLELNKIQEEKPYIERVKTEIVLEYNPNYGDDRICKCGHQYYRHFDTYESMSLAGCKYCNCWEFKELLPGEVAIEESYFQEHEDIHEHD